jgi:type VI secretion system secreted protein Hcp
MDRLRASGKTVLLIAVAVLVAAGTVAVASIPGSDGVITACWDHTAGATYGALRVIDPSLSGNTRSANEYSCQTGETQITWNQQGPAGPAGPTGPAGPNGPSGPAGPQGPQASSSFLSFTGGVKNAILLKVPGIQGESTIKGHKGEIDLKSTSFGASRPKMGEIIVVKRFDKSSPALFQAVATGKHFSKVTIVFHRKAGRGQQDYLTFTMKDAIISSLKNISSPADPRPQEQLTLNFTKLTTEYSAGGHHTSINLTPHQFAVG